MSQQINLFNPIFLKTKKIFSAIALLQAFGLVLVGAALLAAYAAYQSAGLNKSAALVSAQLRGVEVQVAKLRAETGTQVKNNALEVALAKLEAEIKSRQQIADILKRNDFGNTQGFSPYMQAFARQIPSGLWLTGFTLAAGGAEINLQGRTLKPEFVPVYVTQLTHENIMQGKSFGSLQMRLPATVMAAPSANSEVKKLAGAPQSPPYIEFDLRSSYDADKNSSVKERLK
jgi:Tfp pilus assembly protein PilN